MRRMNGEEGFSLIEVTMAALLTVGIIGAVFGLLNRNQQIFVTESGVTDMNQNMRTVVDLLTRDAQSAGMGLPSRNPGSFAAIFCTDGANGAPDKLMIANGDPYAPTADVTSQTASPSEFLCVVPPDVTVTGTGSSTQVTYLNASSTATPFYKSFATSSKSYIVYDDTKAMVMTLTQDGQLTGTGAAARIKLSYNSATYWNPPTTFGSTIDLGAPDYLNSKIALLGSLVGYRLNQATNELERTEDLTNWYAIARGVVDFQVTYRVFAGKDVNGDDIWNVTGAPVDRQNIRSITFKIIAETPDLQPNDKGYRRAVQQFEVTPRNFNLLNNTNLSAPIN